MYIKSISLTNFRNHIDTKTNLDKGINILLGQNAQGKTNLLEAIYLSCVGQGWRAGRDSEMITFDKDFSLVNVKAQKEFGEIDIAIKLGKGTKKSISLNQLPISKVSELMGQINCIFFSPDELRIIKEAPADRRRFLNIDISQIDKSYFYALLRYNKILSQRNAYLKNNTDLRELSIWDEQLIKVGNIIIQKRAKFLQELSPYIKDTHGRLTDNKENISISYETPADFESELLNSRERDLRLRTTTVGPHRDDIEILINGKDVRLYGSQGQQRTVSLSIKLAELELFKKITGETPILLLDDVFSELDSSRQSRLLTSLENIQTIITTTEKPSFGKIINIKNGKII